MAETLTEILSVESTQQGAGQSVGLHGRYEMASLFQPATTARKGLTPPLAPAGKRLWPDIQGLNCNPCRRFGDRPCTKAVIRITITPRYTYLPRKRTEGGVLRRR